MNQQKSIFANYSKWIFITSLFCFASTGLFAQISVSSRLTDVTIPNNTTKIYVDLKGGDGGNAEIQDNCRASGGAGAIVKALFEVGTGSNQIPPGSTLRFIKGEKGGSESSGPIFGSGTAGGGGGGGSAILYKASGGNTWNILAVAGGGGGAYAGMFSFGCTDKPDGRGGQSTSNGGDGKEPLGTISGGENGSAGVSYKHPLSQGSSGGAGAYGSSSMYNAKQGYPAGGAGGRVTDGQSGGWGFGGGGASYFGPGGGGGYSGGGAGDSGYAGGGGSYLSENTAPVLKSITKGSDGGGNKEDGYVKYQFNPAGILYAPLGNTNGPDNQVYISAAADLDMVVYKSGHANVVDDGTGIVLRERVYNDFFMENILWVMDESTNQIKLGSNMAKCIHLQNQNTYNGSKLQLWTCNTSEAQQWLFDEASGLIKYKADTNKCLIMTSYDSPLKIWDCNSSAITDDQKKWVTHAVDASIYINMKSTLKQSTVYTIAKPGDIDDIHNGIILKRAEKNYQGSYYKANQIWKYIPLTNAFQYVRDDSKCIDLEARNTSNGTPIQLYSCHGGDAQKWTMYNYMIKYKANMDKCIIWNNGLTSKVNNSQLVIWDCNDSRVTDEQKLWFYTFEDE